jgi:ABC-type Zn uptake system ZnuABC Zn-binding protein ZnuA
MRLALLRPSLRQAIDSGEPLRVFVSGPPIRTFVKKEPGAPTLATPIAQAHKEKIRVPFVQPRLDKRQAMQLARAIGAKVIAVDPLAADYADNLRRQVARQLAVALLL